VEGSKPSFDADKFQPSRPPPFNFAGANGNRLPMKYLRSIHT